MPNGTMVGRALAIGRNLMERIDNWYKVNGPPLAAHFFEVSPRCTSAFVTKVTEDESDDEFDAGPTVRELEDLENLQVFAQAAQRKFDDASKNLRQQGPNTRGKAKTPVEKSSADPVRPVPNAVTKKAPVQNQPAPSQPMQPQQYKYSSNVESPTLVQKVMDKVLMGEVTLTTEEVFAVAPDIRKNTRELLAARKIPVGSTLLNECTCPVSVNVAELKPRSDNKIAAQHSVSLRVLDVGLKNNVNVEGILDDGSQIIAIRRDIWERTGEALRSDYKMVMESANSTTNGTMGVINDLKITIGGYDFYVQAQVIENAPYELLLGRPFSILTEANTKNFKDGSSHLTMVDPNSKAQISIPTRERERDAKRRKNCRAHQDPNLHEEGVDSHFQ